MPTEPKNNCVIFRVTSRVVTERDGGPVTIPDAGIIKLSLCKAWTIKGGVEPDVNMARVPWTEYEKFGGDPIQVIGDIEFWFSNDPDKQPSGADHVIHNVTLVDVEASAFGCREENGERSIVEYQLFFADARHWWLPPRGKHLTAQGIINGPNDTNLRANSDLILGLLSKLGVKLEKIAIDYTAVNALTPMRNLEWRGSHPQIELKKILDELGLVLAPQSDGVHYRIDVAGVGPVPGIPADRNLGLIDLPNIDRRGKTVVFSSAPYATIITRTMGGPNYDTFIFVVQVGTGESLQWKDIDLVCPIVGGIRTIPSGPEYERVWDQIFRFIRFAPAKGVEVIKETFEASAPGRAIMVKAKIAIQQADGSWNNSADFIDVPAISLMKTQTQEHNSKGNTIDAYVIGVAGRLCDVAADGVMDRDGNMKDVEDGDITVRYSSEQIQMRSDDPLVPLEDENGKLQTLYFQSGYVLDDGGQVRKLKNEELANALSDKETLTIRDERMIVNGGTGDSGETSAEAARAARAWRWLKGSGGKPKKRSVIGFYPVELSGKVAEVEWSQKDVRTDIDMDTWFTPMGLWSLGKMESERKALAEKFPGQAATAQTRAAMGGASASQPSVLLTPAGLPTETPAVSVVVKLNDAATGIGETKSGMAVHLVADRQSLQALATGTPKWVLGTLLGTKTTISTVDYPDVQVDAVGWAASDYMVLQMTSGQRVWDYVRAHG